VGWQEVARAGLPPGTVVQYWDTRADADVDAGVVTAAAHAGARVLLSPAPRAYLDMKWDATAPLGLEWAGHIELRDAYDWEPLDLLPGLPDGSVLGVEAALWSETIRTPADLFTLLLPRLAAFAEVAWSAPERRDWDGFAARLRAIAPRWTAAGLPWYRSPQIDW
jgi:hexosaminidase